MNPLNYRIYLDIYHTASQLTLSVKQGEKGSRLIISLTARGIPYQITDECYAIFSAIKPDGTTITNNCTIQNNTIIYELTSQTTSVAGALDCEVSIMTNDGQEISSPRFSVVVYKTVAAEIYDESSSEVTSLSGLISETRSLISDIETKLENGEFEGEKGETGDGGKKYIDLKPFIESEASVDVIAKSFRDAIEEAYRSSPKGSKRADIVFYDTGRGDANKYKFLSYQDLASNFKSPFVSNCNYYFHDITWGGGSLNLSGLQNCDFYDLNLSSAQTSEVLRIQDGSNLVFQNCKIDNDQHYAIFLHNCSDVYFENCVFIRGSYLTGKNAFIYITDDGVGNSFKWLMFENCIFNTSNLGTAECPAISVKDVEAKVEGARHLVTVSNCHFSDLSKVSGDDVEASSTGAGKVVVVSTEDDLEKIKESIPDKLSDLENDVGYITDADIPTKVSQLENDREYATREDISSLQQEHQSFATKGELSQAQAGNMQMFATKGEIPTVPTKVSELENDENFAKKSDLSTVYRYKGSVDYYEELPKTGNVVGDTYNVANAYGVYQGGTNFSWDGTSWDALGGALDLSVFVRKTDYATHNANGIMLATDKAKLDSLQAGANNYVLPTATGARLGGIIIGKYIDVDENGIANVNIPDATITDKGLMTVNDKYALSWMYANLGRNIHAYAEIGWENGGEPNKIWASINYTYTGYKKGLLNLSFVLTSENVTNEKWLISIAKLENVFGTKFKRGTDANDHTTWLYGGSWVRQKEEVIQETPHNKAKTCCITPYVILPCKYVADGSGGVRITTVNTSSFEPNEVIQMWNVPVEEA